MVEQNNNIENEFDWLTLDEDEEIIWVGGPHKNSLISGIAIGAVLSIIVIGLFIIAASYLSYKNTKYVITTHGIYRKKGAMSKDVKKINLDKVQNTSFSQDIIGSMFGYGSVEISTAGGSGVELKFRAVPNPQEIQELISVQIEKYTKPETNEGTEEVTLKEVLDKLEEIRETIEGDTNLKTEAQKE